MFPIPFNFPFKKSDGSLSTIGAEISAGGGGGGYTLPTASASTKGGVKIGSGLTMTGEVLSNDNPTPYTLPTAAADTLGGVKVGSGLSINDGVLSANGGGYTLPTASASTKGGVKIGSGLTMTGEVLSNDNPTPYTLPTAAADTLGGIKVGSGLSINDGVLSATGGGGGFSPTTGQITVGYAMSSPSYNQLYKFGNMVMIGFIGDVSGSETQNVIVGELPDGFRPSKKPCIPCVVSNGSSYYDAYISIAASGGVNKSVVCTMPSDLQDASKSFSTVHIWGIFAL